MVGNSNSVGHGAPFGNCNGTGHGSWRPNQNGQGYACFSCYSHFGAGKKVKAAADTTQTAITQFFKKQKQ
jgi:hypothetical protein